jgi:hypothetical protein
MIARWYAELSLGEGVLGCAVVVLTDARNYRWLVLSVPVGMIQLLYHVEYPLESRKNEWLASLEAALVDVANHVAVIHPFDFAHLGEDAGSSEASASDTAEVLDILHRRGGVLIGHRLWERLAAGTEAALLPSGLRWLPIERTD